MCIGWPKNVTENSICSFLKYVDVISTCMWLYFIYLIGRFKKNMGVCIICYRGNNSFRMNFQFSSNLIASVLASSSLAKCWKLKFQCNLYLNFANISNVKLHHWGRWQIWSHGLMCNGVVIHVVKAILYPICKIRALC